MNEVLPPPATWPDRYLLEEAIGRGSAGTVFRARDRETGTFVALKRLTSLDASDVKRFEREFAILDGLSHPAIVPCLGAVTSATGEPYLAMKWIDGENLRERLRRAELTLEETLALARRVLGGLAFAHANGILHRDVKPANVLLEGRDPARAVVVDFGIARRASGGDTVTRGGQMIGTPGYASPEQIQGEPLDARSDVYSLGCLLFRCLAGRLPFEGDDIVDLLTRVAREEAPSLAVFRPDLPAGFIAVVDAALARDAVDRPADAGAFAMDVERACALSFPSGAALLSSRPPSAHAAAPLRGASTVASPVVSVSDAPSETVERRIEPSAELVPGSTFGERYRVVRFVARGGFGEVYEARHLVLDTPVAIKILRADRLLRDDVQTSAFLGEARLLAKLRHPHLVTVLDAGVTPTRQWPWMALEWCPGETLDSLVASGRIRTPMSPHDAWALLRPAAEAIAHAHAHGIAHRDFKPSNVMMVREGERYSPRVVDFGLAKLVEGATPMGDTWSEGAARFTPAYVAPEQAGGAASGPWTDVHAMGLVLSELVAGKRAYPEGMALSAALDPHRPTPRALGAHVDDRFEQAMAGALAFNPVDRFRDAAAFLAHVDAALGPPVVKLSPAVEAAPVARRGKGASMALIGALVALVLILVASGVAGYLSARSKRHAAPSAFSVVSARPRTLDRTQPRRYDGKSVVTDRAIPSYEAADLVARIEGAGFRVRQTLAATSEQWMYSLTLDSECGGTLSYWRSRDSAEASRVAGEYQTSGPGSLVALQDNRFLVLSLYDETGPDPICNEALLDALAPPRAK